MAHEFQSVRTLPTEIITEILLKLPVEPLLRCKSVCKSWRSLISGPHFVKSHLNLSAHNNTRLIFSFLGSNILNTCFLDEVINDSNALEVVDYPFKSVTKAVKFVGSCNGLLCLGIYMTNDTIIQFIWNPSTRKYHKVPSDAYQTNVPGKQFGFGYDESTDDYKVVSVSLKPDTGRFETFVKMYSLRNGSWKDIGDFPHDIPCSSSKFVNGALHWLADDDDQWKIIISLDLATETFGEVVLPVFDEGDKYLTLGTLGEWLCVLCDYYNEGRVDLWAMKVYGVKDSWTKLVSVPYMPDPEIDHYLAPLCISNDGMILLTMESNLMIYDSKNNSLSDLKKFDNLVYASTFVESLVSPSSSWT